jgi:hypothetical protein
MWVGWDWRLRTAATNGLIVHHLVIHEFGQPLWWWWCQMEKTPYSSTRALRQTYQQRHLGASRRKWRRSENFAYQYLRYFKGYLTCCKILRHGTFGFRSHPKEGLLRTFIAIKNPSPRQGLNPRPLGPLASTLTTTPPRRRDFRFRGRVLWSWQPSRIQRNKVLLK